jgi:hypothetical protein
MEVLVVREELQMHPQLQQQPEVHMAGVAGVAISEHNPVLPGETERFVSLYFKEFRV